MKKIIDKNHPDSIFHRFLLETPMKLSEVIQELGWGGNKLIKNGGIRIMKATCKVIMVLVSIFCLSGTGNAAVSGPCSDCHTMHNSQGNETMQRDGNGDPQAALLRGTCLGCHTTTGTDPLDGDGYPYVQMSSGGSDSNCLAGGHFVVADPSDNNSNTQHDMGSFATPAGMSQENTWYNGTSEGLSCGGTNGCHGNQLDQNTMEAIAGGHHAPTAYRMLYIDGVPVVGDGATDYEEALIAGGNSITPGDTVNVYSASQSEASISTFCAKCHSDFHGSETIDDGVGSSWIRHPTDVGVPNTWEIGGTSYTLTADDYRNNPVGYDNADINGTRKVTCLSCHRAHGTENDDLLRWGYDASQVAGGGNTFGCLGCHDAQR